MKTEWISVKDRLPDNDDDVLVCREIKPDSTKYPHPKKILIDHYCPTDPLGPGWYSVSGVTHWMSLPEPPKP